MSTILKGFKDFILRGNVIDLAVAVVIGAAFGALVTAFTEAFITPVINSFFYLLGISGDGIGGVVSLPGDQTINIGLMVSAIIAFLITAAVVYFVFVMPMNKARDRFAKDEEESDETAEDLLAEIRDLLKEQKHAE